MEHETSPDGRSDAMPAGAAAADAPDDPAAGAPQDPLLVVRAQLDAVDELPLDERADVFERTHAIVTDELKKLELT